MDDVTPVAINDPRLIREISRLAELLGADPTEAVGDAVGRRLAELDLSQRDGPRAERSRAMRAALKAMDELPKLGPRLTDRDFYNEDGTPL